MMRLQNHGESLRLTLIRTIINGELLPLALHFEADNATKWTKREPSFTMTKCKLNRINHGVLGLLVRIGNRDFALEIFGETSLSGSFRAMGHRSCYSYVCVQPPRREDSADKCEHFSIVRLFTILLLLFTVLGSVRTCRRLKLLHC